MKKYKHIMIAVDQTAMAKIVVESALSLLAEDMSLSIITVVDYPQTLGISGMDMQELVDEDVKKAEQFLNNLSENYHLSDQVKQLRLRTVIGNPHKLLASTLPEEEGADLLIIGKTSKQNLIDQMFVGSTAKHILKEAVCDVMLVKTSK